MSDEEIAQLEKEVSEQGEVVTQVKEVCSSVTLQHQVIFVLRQPLGSQSPPMQHLICNLCHLDLVVIRLHVMQIQCSANHSVRGSPHDCRLHWCAYVSAMPELASVR